MTPPPNPDKERIPLSAFDPRYKELLLRGSKEEFSISSASIKELRALRATLHTYRSRAKRHYGEEHKAEWEPLYQCTIYLIDDLKGGGRLRFAPRAKEFDHLLSGVVDVPDLKQQEREELLEQLIREQKAHDQ